MARLEDDLHKCKEAHHEALLGLARSHAQQGMREQALLALWAAVDAGFGDAAALREDEAFAAYREEAAFREIVRASWVRGYLDMLERDERESFQMKSEVLRALDLGSGNRVADLGAGSGYFTLPIARAIGPEGIVWAVDVFQEMLDFIARRVRIEKLANVRLFKADRESLCLPEGDLDLVLMSDMLHYIPERAPLLRRLRSSLKAGGRMAVLDFTPKTMQERPWGPSPEQQFSQETIVEEMSRAGMDLQVAYGFLPEQHFTIFVPAGSIVS